MVGIVPDIFQVPINAPMPNKIKNGVVTDPIAVCADLEMSSQGCPFLRMITATTMSQKINATCTGPSRAFSPNIKTAPAIRTMRVTAGMIASAYDGSLILLGVMGWSAIRCLPLDGSGENAHRAFNDEMNKYHNS